MYGNVMMIMTVDGKESLGVLTAWKSYEEDDEKKAGKQI